MKTTQQRIKDENPQAQTGADVGTELSQEQLDQAAGGMGMMISLSGSVGKMIKSTTESAAKALAESKKP